MTVVGKAGHSDVVFTFTTATYTDAQLRNWLMAPDRLALTLLAHPSVDRLLLADPYRSVASHLKRRLVTERRLERRPNGALYHSPMRLRRGDPTTVAQIERAYERYDARLERKARASGMREPTVITMHPLIAGFAPLRWARSVTFYADDDWASHPGYAAWWPLFREAYARIRANGLRVCAVSKVLLDRIAPAGPSAVVPNGVEPKEWTAFDRPPAWFAELPRPRILYVGTIDGRLDTAVLERIAAAYPSGSLAMAGYLPDREPFAALLDAPNVHWRPTLPRREVAAMVAAADACVIPHRRTELTSAMSPLKAYEYLAGGRPVVATDLPPMRGVDPRLRLVAEGDDFLAALDEALTAEPLPEGERLRFVTENSWRTRHDRVLEIALS